MFCHKVSQKKINIVMLMLFMCLKLLSVLFVLYLICFPVC